MRYPMGEFGTEAEVDAKWYIARRFGERVDNWWHEGVDWNLLTGTITDDREPLYPIAAGKIVYYHYSKHPGAGYGRHIFVKIEGPWEGPRWAHYAHCHADDFMYRAVKVDEGTMIARISNTGWQPHMYPHLHFAICRKDPGGNLDRYARSEAELHEYWEDPVAFIQTWMQPQMIITDDTRIPQIKNMRVGEIKAHIETLERKIIQVREIVDPPPPPR